MDEDKSYLNQYLKKEEMYSQVEVYLKEGHTTKFIFEKLKLQGYPHKHSSLRKWIWRNFGSKKDMIDASSNETKKMVAKKPSAEKLPTSVSRSETSPFTSISEKANTVTQSTVKKMTLEEQERIARKYYEESKKSDKERDSWMDYKPPSK